MFHSPFVAIRQHADYDFISASFNLFCLLFLCLFSYYLPPFQAHNTLMRFRSQVPYFARFFVHRLAQIACKPFLVLVRRVTLFQSKLVNFCLQRCYNFLIFNHHTTTLKWIRKSLDFLRKTPLTAYEFGIIRKSITIWKADRRCRTAFSGISTPENHTPLSCFKIDGLKFAQKPTQKPSIFVSKIIKFPNQSLSYSLPINPKARYIKSCWPCIDCSFARRR